MVPHLLRAASLRRVLVVFLLACAVCPALLVAVDSESDWSSQSDDRLCSIGGADESDEARLGQEMEEFFTRYFEQEPYITSGAGKSFLGGVCPSARASTGGELASGTRDRTSNWPFDLQFGMDEVFMLLDTTGTITSPASPSNHRMTSTDMKLVKRVSSPDGEEWAAAYTVDHLPNTTAIDSRLARWALDRGFTLVLNRANYRYEAIHSLCSLLTRRVFGFRVQANLYLTPANSSGFEAHFDWQEVIVMQLLGEKRWTVLDEPLLALPRVDQRFKPTRAQMATLTRRQHTLTPGTMLYLPSGTIHEATTTARDSFSGAADASPAADVLPASLHLTLGVEVDPLFTVHGLAHIFLDHLRQKNDTVLHQQLMAQIPSSTCAAMDPLLPPEAAASTLTNIDLLHWAIFDAASRTNETDAYMPRARRFRRSLWGLHRWSERAVRRTRAESGSRVPTPPRSHSLAALLLSTDAQQHAPDSHSTWTALDQDARYAIAFHRDAARRLLSLLRALEQADFSLSHLLPLLLQQQKDRRRSARANAAGAKRPVSLLSDEFDDELLLPLLQNTLDDHHLPAIMARRRDEHAAACIDEYFADLQSRLRGVWHALLDSIDADAWERYLHEDREQVGDDATAPESEPTEQQLWPPSLDDLTPSLSLLQRTLLDSRARLLETQAGYVVEDTRRQAAYLESRRAASQTAADTTSRQEVQGTNERKDEL